jgi:hypothetical protein
MVGVFDGSPSEESFEVEQANNNKRKPNNPKRMQAFKGLLMLIPPLN